MFFFSKQKFAKSVTPKEKFILKMQIIVILCSSHYWAFSTTMFGKCHLYLFQCYLESFKMNMNGLQIYSQ